MPGAIYKHTIWCVDESAYVSRLTESQDPITTCPNNTAHSVDSDSHACELYADASPSLDSAGNLKVLPEKSAEPRANIISPNFCDRLTWHSTAERETGEVLSPNHNRTRFHAQYHNWVDLNHGRVSDEDSISADKLAVIKVDGVTKDEVTPFICLDMMAGNWPGDYVIHHEHGIVEFAQPVEEGVDVTADYSHVVNSQWIMAPYEGKILSMRHSEVQFSENIVMKDSIHFTVWGYVDVFAPQYLTTNGGPYPPGTKIQIEDKVYKTMQDFINESNGAYPTIPQIGGPMRGTKGPILEMPWTYQTKIDLYHSYGMEVRVYLENDIPCGGDIGTIAFYCVSLPEPT